MEAVVLCLPSRNVTGRLWRAGALSLGLGLLGAPAFAQALTIYGLGTTSRAAPPNVFLPFGAPAGAQGLISISPTTGAPVPYGNPVRAVTPITGVDAGQVLVGMDYRPATGELYALGYDAATRTAGKNARLYVLDPSSGAVTPVGAVISLDLGERVTRIGFDFNPVLDRIRVEGGNRANFLLNPNDGSIALQDGTLTYAAPNAALVPVIGAVAYTNSFLGSTSTTLYALDVPGTGTGLLDPNTPNDGFLSVQTTPNDATLTDPKKVALGGNAFGDPVAVNVDIYHNADAGTDEAYLTEVTSPAANGVSSSNFYSLALATGVATKLGNTVPASLSTPFDVRDIAVVIPPPPFLTWTGATSTNWATATNWLPARVPTSTDDVTIPGGVANQPAVSGSQAARAVTLGSGATLTSNDGSTLAVGGNFANNGGALAGSGSGTVALAGTASQVVGGTSISTFQNLTVGTAGASLAGPAAVRRVLLLDGTLTATGQSLTLLSDANNTAHVVNSVGTVVGPVTVQRYIDGSTNNGFGYRHYASPVQKNTVADLTTTGYVPVVNPAYNTAAQPGAVTPFPTVYGYNEARVNGSGDPSPQDFDKGFFSPDALTDALVPGQGYTVNIPASQTVNFVGLLNNGDVPRTGLTRGGQTESGWQLLGNPYPSPISWTKTFGNGATGLFNEVHVVKSTGQYAGGYASYVNGVGVNGGIDEIAAMQGFFVRVAAAGVPGALTFRNSGRLTTYANPAFQRGSGSAPLVRLALANNTGRTDEAVVYFDAAATTGFDAALDAHKLNLAGSTMALATEAAGAVVLSIDARPTIGTADVLVPLRVQAAAGRYTISATELLRLPAGVRAFLRDALTGTATDLVQQSSYPFAVTAGASASGRFSLLLTTQGVLATAPAAISQQVNVFPNPTRGVVSVGLPAALARQATEATLVNALGQTVLRATLPAGPVLTLALPGVAQGVYTLRLVTSEGTVNKRLIVE